MASETIWPTEIRISPDRRMLTVAFDDGISGTVSAELLRVRSPSAEVQGHSPSERKTIPGKRHVTIIGAEPVGNYAIRLKFDDLHDTGIYGWDTLRRFVTDQTAMMADYEAELAAKGWSRDPNIPVRR
jgi:DUF971 family protein